MTLGDYLRNPPVRWATDAEVRREFGISREEWLRRWREPQQSEKQQLEELRKKGKAA